MSLNHLMHPRNVYKNNKPDFKKLAVKYEEFRRHATTDLKGKVHLDFKKPDCLKALTWALLKDDFNLDILIPTDRLIPTIPLRLNYILWLEDILNTSQSMKYGSQTTENTAKVCITTPEAKISGTTYSSGLKGTTSIPYTSTIIGIDIGCGATCVYPLLGCQKNGWKFIATETDNFNIDVAKRNVQKNGREADITVVKVDQGQLLATFKCSYTQQQQFDFCMCNPPFFGSALEAWGGNNRTNSRPEPNSVNTASPQEMIYPGGEVEFVRGIIADSLDLKTKIRVYTSMVGKKSSLLALKDDLTRIGVTNIGTTEFCQGRTMRWGLGWSYDPHIKFPKPPSKEGSELKAKPLLYIVPKECCSNGEYSVQTVAQKLRQVYRNLQIDVEVVENSPECIKSIIRASTNTWSKQRQKRRQRLKSGLQEVGQGALLPHAVASPPGDIIDTAGAGSRFDEESGGGVSRKRPAQDQGSGQSGHKKKRLEHREETSETREGDEESRSETRERAEESRSETRERAEESRSETRERAEESRSETRERAEESRSETRERAEESRSETRERAEESMDFTETEESREITKETDERINNNDEHSDVNGKDSEGKEIEGAQNCIRNVSGSQVPVGCEPPAGCEAPAGSQAPQESLCRDNQLLVKAEVCVLLKRRLVMVEMKWLEGCSKECMHQILQYCMNEFKKQQP